MPEKRGETSTAWVFWSSPLRHSRYSRHSRIHGFSSVTVLKSAGITISINSRSEECAPDSLATQSPVCGQARHRDDHPSILVIHGPKICGHHNFQQFQIVTVRQFDMFDRRRLVHAGAGFEGDCTNAFVV